MKFHLNFPDFVDQYASLERDRFLATFPEPILLIDFKGIREVPENLKGNAQPPPMTALTQFTPGHDENLDMVVVAPLRKSDRNKMANAVTLGRARTNDIVLPHGVISKLHAFFRKDPATGNLSITDADSRYGTAVNSENLVPADPYPLNNKSTLLFAKFVQAHLYFPRDFYQQMHLMLHQGRGR
jgi:hypothetical protein